MRAKKDNILTQESHPITSAKDAEIEITPEPIKKEIQINFEAGQILLIASLASTVLVLAGYIYNYFLFLNFGVKVSHFFQISDYLSTSIDKISIIALFTAAPITLLLAIFQSRKNYFWIGKFLSAALVFSFIFNAIVGDKYLYSTIFFAFTFFIATYLIDKNNLGEIKGFKTLFNFTLFSLMFFMYCIIIANSAAKRIKDGRTNSNYEVAFSEEYKAINELTYVTTNSQYIFFYDTHAKRVVVYPHSAIKMITVNNDETINRIATEKNREGAEGS